MADKKRSVAPHRTSRLSGIDTSWAVVFGAHGDDDAGVTARHRLLLRYYRSIRRYLVALVRDAEAADELTHDFVVRFLRGDFKQANPSRGRFRDLLKRALRNLAIDYWRRRQKELKKASTTLPFDVMDPYTPAFNAAAADETFLRSWRKEIANQAAQSLARFDSRSGHCYYAILRFKTAHPRMRSKEMASRFGVSIGKRLTATAFRQQLRRARERYAEALVTEVARSLRTTDPDRIETELIDLSLHFYCRSAISRLRKANFLSRPQRSSEKR
jgi:RNA polymerase sigma-70 factor (ECF subfamily)